jgi:crossover junction endodeoxyribonuclease RusA
MKDVKMYSRAGFDRRHKETGLLGWVRPFDGGRFAPAALIRFVRENGKGDFAWLHLSHDPKFIYFGEQIVAGTWPEFSLPDEWQHGLPQSKLPVRERRPAPVKLILPYPISANRYWRTFAYLERVSRRPRAVTAVSDEAEAFKVEVGWCAKQAGVRVPFGGPVEMRVRLIPENRVCMDLDNALKVVIDALKGIVYEDDDQIMRIVAERGDADPVGGKRIEIEVGAYVMPMALEQAA